MLRSGWARTLCIIALASTLFVLRNAHSTTAPEPGDLRGVGKVTFPISCAPDVQSDFARGVALLHSFFYEEARRVFTSVAERDPKCAMAQWGIAMTWWHPIWTPPTPDEMRAGKAAIEKAMSLNTGSDRERGFITALNTYYNTAEGSSAGPVGQSCHGPVGPRDRVVAYEKAMRQLRDKYPDDFEVQTFYAFAVLSSGYATPNDTSLSKQLEAAGILEKLWKQNANHPGVVHYLIHSYDYPQFAQRGLAAAQTYDSIAPWVPHALHMPSHIFTRLGMWDESIAANRASAEASRAYAAMRHRDATEAEELHALDYMAYSYLQEAQDGEAKKIVDLAAKVRKTNPELEFSAAYALAAIPTRYAFERNRLGGSCKLAHSERATLVFVPVHGSSHRIWSRTRTGAYRRPRRRAKSDRTNAATTGGNERSKVRLFQKPSRPADASSFGVGGSSRRQEGRRDRYAAAGRGFRRHTRQASRFARSVRSDSRTARHSAARSRKTNGRTARI